MSNDTPDTFKFARLPIIIYMLAASILAGCGDASTSATSGGGLIVAGVGVGGTGVIRSSLTPQDSQTATDLINAIVFVDTNNNRLPDPGETAAVTDQNGNYTLPADNGDSTAYPLLLQAIAGQTIIKSTGQPVTADYVIELVQKQ